MEKNTFFSTVYIIHIVVLVISIHALNFSSEWREMKIKANLDQNLKGCLDKLKPSYSLSTFLFSIIVFQNKKCLLIWYWYKHGTSNINCGTDRWWMGSFLQKIYTFIAFSTSVFKFGSIVQKMRILSPTIELWRKINTRLILAHFFYQTRWFFLLMV